MTGDDNGHFTMDSNTGYIKVAKMLDREMVCIKSMSNYFSYYNNRIIFINLNLYCTCIPVFALSHLKIVCNWFM